MTLYLTDNCPYCISVCSELDDRGIEYDIIEVPIDKSKRFEVFKISGQRLVPVLLDEDRVISDSQEIISYIEEKF